MSTKIRVDGLDYPIIIKPGVEDGAVSLQKQVIMLSPAEHGYMSQLLWHEIIHLINCNRLGDKLTETQINALACGIVQVIMDNDIDGQLHKATQEHENTEREIFK